MTIYVDPIFDNVALPTNAQAARHGTRWCHLICDGDLEELHKFAKSIGLRREWFQASSVPHYDLTPGKRAQAVKKGAIEKGHQELSLIKREWMKQWNGGNPDWMQPSKPVEAQLQLTLE